MPVIVVEKIPEAADTILVVVATLALAWDCSTCGENEGGFIVGR